MIRTSPGIAALQEVYSRMQPKVNEGVTGASSASPKYDYGHQRLLYVLNNRTSTQTDNPPEQIDSSKSNSSVSQDRRDNSFQVGAKIGDDGNLYISREVLGYNTPMNAEDQLKLVEKYSDKNMERDSMLSGMSSLSNAFGKTGGFSTVFGSYNPR